MRVLHPLHHLNLVNPGPYEQSNYDYYDIKPGKYSV